MLNISTVLRFLQELRMRMAKRQYTLRLNVYLVNIGTPRIL